MYAKKSHLISDSYIVGPDKHCGYVPLINCAESYDHANCRISRVSINGKFKIIIYTVRDIDAGE